MLTDAITSIKSYLYERTVSPLLGSVIVSWILWNYKTVLLLTSDLKYAEKLSMISELYSSNREYFGTGIAFPILTAGFYLFIFPWPAKWVYQFTLKRRKEMNQIKQDIEKQKLLTQEQSMKIRAEIDALEDQLTAQMEKQDRIVARKDEEIDRLQKDLEELHSGFEAQSRDLERVQSELDEASKYQEDNIFASEVPKSPEYHINKLRETFGSKAKDTANSSSKQEQDIIDDSPVRDTSSEDVSESAQKGASIKKIDPEIYRLNILQKLFDAENDGLLKEQVADDRYAQFYLKELIKAGLVEEYDDPETSKTYFYITHEGEKKIISGLEKEPEIPF